MNYELLKDVYFLFYLDCDLIFVKIPKNNILVNSKNLTELISKTKIKLAIVQVIFYMKYARITPSTIANNFARLNL